MLIFTIIVIIAFGIWAAIIAGLIFKRNELPTLYGDMEPPADGYTDTTCRKCGGKLFSIRVTDIAPLGAIRRSVTEVICQICGKTAFKTFNSYREKNESDIY